MPEISVEIMQIIDERESQEKKQRQKRKRGDRNYSETETAK